MTRTRRLLTPLLAGLLALGFAAGCERTKDVVPGDDWHPDAQFAPSLRPAFGVRVTDGELRFWTGSACGGVTRLGVNLDVGKDSRAEAVFVAGAGGATVEQFTLDAAPAGMTVKSALPTGYDVTKASTAELSVYGPPATWGSSVNLAQVRTDSAAHPSDTYYFQDVGWMNAAQVTAQNGKTFLATCTPDLNKG